MLLQAISTATNTLCSQAHGAKNHDLVGAWLHVGIALSSVMAFLVAAAWAVTGLALSAAGFDAHEAILAGRFAQWSIVGVWPFLVYPVVTAWLQAQGIVFPMVFTNAAVLLVNVALNFLLIFGVGSWGGLGFDGSAIATAISRWLLLLVVCAYVLWRGIHKKTLPHGIQFKYLTDGMLWHEFFVKQSLPRFLGRAAEEWQLQLVALFAAQLGTVSLATHTALLDLFYFATSALYGLTNSTSVRIGHHLGAGDVRSAQMVAKLNLAVCMTVAVAVASVFCGAHSVIGYLFSKDPRVVAKTAELAWFVGGGYVFLCLFYTSMAVVAGFGRPRIIAIAFLVGAWCVCIPLGYVLSHTLGLGLVGLWTGLVVGYSVVTAIIVTNVLRTDWDDVSAEAVIRSKQSEAVQGGAGTALLSGTRDHEQPKGSISQCASSDLSNEGPSLNSKESEALFNQI